MAFTAMPIKSSAVIKIMVVLYRPGVGSTVPAGATSSSLARVTVLFSTSSSSCSMPAPNVSRNVSGPIEFATSRTALSNSNCLSVAVDNGPSTPATLHAVKSLPCIAPIW